MGKEQGVLRLTGVSRGKGRENWPGGSAQFSSLHISQNNSTINTCESKPDSRVANTIKNIDKKGRMKAGECLQ